MKTFKVSGSDKLVMIDDEDYERITKYKWHVIGNHIYRATNRRYEKPRYVNWPLSGEVMRDFVQKFDHADRDSFNNQKSNLRLATHGNNMMNRDKFTACSSKFKGVYFDGASSRPWKVQITANKKQIYIGRFETEDEAARAYNKVAQELHKEFAVLNPV